MTDGLSQFNISSLIGSFNKSNNSQRKVYHQMDANNCLDTGTLNCIEFPELF